VCGATLTEPHALTDMCSNVLSMFKFMTQHSPTLCDFKNAVEQAICEDDDEEDTHPVPARTRAGKQSQRRDSAVGRPSKGSHMLWLKDLLLGWAEIDIGAVQDVTSTACL
jgi:hypothetical protein